MARLFNMQPVQGVVIVPEGAKLYNNRPVIGVRYVADGLFFSGNRRVLGIEIVGEAAIDNASPVIGAVVISDSRTLYNNAPVVPVTITGFLKQDMVAVLGDSRAAQVWQDAAVGTTPLRKSATNHLPWALALSGQRVSLTGNFGKSGDRTDQIAARLDAAIASGAGRLSIIAGNNDIGQDYPSLTTSGITAFTNILSWVDYAWQNFKITSLVALEAGSHGWTGQKVVQVRELNQRLRDAAATRPYMDLLDLPSVFWVGGIADTTIAFKPDILLDGTHEAVLGGYEGGKLLAAALTARLPPRKSAAVNNILVNPLFATLTGGTAQAGATGTIPSGWIAVRNGGGSGTQTMAVSSGVPADGSAGNEIILDCTFGAVGDVLSFKQDFAAASTLWAQGDSFQPGVELVVDSGAVNLCTAYLYLIAAYDSASAISSDLETTTSGLGPGEGYKANLLGPGEDTAGHDHQELPQHADQHKRRRPRLRPHPHPPPGAGPRAGRLMGR
jgi:lysophospholipase L1-like esterase